MMRSFTHALIAAGALFAATSAFATEYKKVIQCANGTAMDEYVAPTPETIYPLPSFQIVIRGEHALNHFSSYGVAQPKVGADGQMEIVLQGLREYYKSWEGEGSYWTEYRGEDGVLPGPAKTYAAAGYSPLNRRLGIFVATEEPGQPRKVAEYVFSDCKRQ